MANKHCLKDKRQNKVEVAIIATLLCFVLLLTLFAGCKKQEKIVVSIMYLSNFAELEKLVESTYPDIDFQCESPTLLSEQIRRLKKNVGPSLVLFDQASAADAKAYLVDISDTVASTVYDGTVMQQLKVEGKTYVLPLPGEYRGYIVNKTLFEQVTTKMPETNTEAVEILYQLKQQNIGTGEDGYNFSFKSDFNSEVGMYFVAGMVPDFLGTVEGNKWLTDFRNKTNNATFSGTWKRSIDFVQQLVDKGLLDAASIAGNKRSIDAVNRLADGTLAAYFGTSYQYYQAAQGSIQNAKQGRGVQYEYIFLPLLSDDGNDEWILRAPAAYIGINKAADSVTQQACKRVLDLLSTTAGQDAVTTDIGRGLSYLNGYQSEMEYIPTGAEQYIENQFVYNVLFPDKVIEYLGAQARAYFNNANYSAENLLKMVDAYYFEGSQDADYELSVVGEISQDMLYTADYNVRRKETEIGNFIADAVAEASQVQMAVVNGGGIRGSFYKGEVYGSDLNAICPYDNLIVVVSMDGATLKAMLENGLSHITDPVPNGRFLQVSGFSYTFDSSRAAGNRLTSVKTADGKELLDNQIYTLAINDYMAGKRGYAEGNGDGFTMLNIYSDDVAKGSLQLVKEVGITYREALRLYFDKRLGVTQAAILQGRIFDESNT